jgi:hypothetical protein
MSFNFGLNSNLEFVALYSNRMVPDSVSQSMKMKGKRIIPMKGDFSLMPAQIDLSDAVYVIGNRLDKDISKIINYAKLQNKPCRIFNDVMELK